MVNLEFLEKIPKTDLHLHLDGAVRIKTLIELAEELRVELPSYDEEELKAKVFPTKYNSLEEYLKCFAITGSVMRNFDALKRIAYELACDQFDIGVRYFEVRFAPQLHAIPKLLDLKDVLAAVSTGLQNACNHYNSKITSHLEPEYGFGIILCALRYFEPSYSQWYEDFWSFHKHEHPKRYYRR
jgi:adenosine deaminase